VSVVLEFEPSSDNKEVPAVGSREWFFAEGAAAFDEGKPLASCPYEKGQAEEWVHGHQMRATAKIIYFWRYEKLRELYARKFISPCFDRGLLPKFQEARATQIALLEAERPDFVSAYERTKDEKDV
jgi:diadenosine tetraphosphatase ApaH/serine/threonine PP2A family protein phosphatase